MHLFFMLIVAALLAAPAVWAATPNASFTTNRSTCMAPCAVYFDARASTDADIAPPFDKMDLSFRWDFGDPGSGVWQRGARAGTGEPHSRNEDTGPYAGHLFESPGTFSITLDVCDGESCDTTTRSVTVSSAASQISPSNTWCFSNDSDFAGCPAGASQVTTSDFDTALNNSCDVQTGSRMCLFKRDDSFVSSATVTLDHRGPGLIGAFGSGNRPKLNWSGNPVFRTGSGAPLQDWRIMDFEVFGTHASSFYNNNSQTTRQLTILRVDIRDGNNTFDFYAGAKFTPFVNMHREIAIVDSSSLSASAAGSIDLFFSIEQSMILGNHFGLQDGPQHVSRWAWLDGVAISHNSMGGGKHNLNVLKIHNIKNNDRSGRFCTSNFILADNLIESGSDNGKDLMIGINGGREYECVRNFIVERNLFRMEQNIDGYVKWMLTLRGGPGMIRNNIFDMSDVEQIGGIRGIQIYEERPGQTAKPDHTRVINNTFFASGNQHSSSGINIEASASDVIVLNNVGYFPQPNIPLLTDNGQNTFKCPSCNVSVTGGTSPFVTDVPWTVWDFVPAAGGPAIGTGVEVPNAAFDFDGNARVAGTAPDLGAFYVLGGTLPPPGSGPPPQPPPPTTPPPTTPPPVAPPAPPVLLP